MTREEALALVSHVGKISERTIWRMSSRENWKDELKFFAYYLELKSEELKKVAESE